MTDEKIVKKVIPVTGVNCPKCRLDIEGIVGKFEGVKEVKMDYMTGNVNIKYDYEKIDLPFIEERIEGLGYDIAYKSYDRGLPKIKKLLGRGTHTLREVDDHTFPGLVLETTKPSLVLFVIDDCPECAETERKLSGMAKPFKNKVYFYKVKCNKTTLCEKYGVSSTPAIILFSKGELIEKYLNKLSLGEIEKRVGSLVQA